MIMRLDEYQTTPPTTTTTLEVSTAPPVCRDQDCVEGWMRSSGRCYHCAEHAEEYCGRDPVFRQSCPVSCKLCLPHQEQVQTCSDDFKPHVCKRLVIWGWCQYSRAIEHCKASCELCDGQPDWRKPLISNVGSEPDPARTTSTTTA